MTERELGRHDAQIAALVEGQKEMKREMAGLREDVQQLLLTVAAVRGGWKVASAIGALVGAGASFAVKVFA